MSNNPIRLQYLFDRYVQNTCTPEEWKEFWLLAGELSDDDPMTDEIRKLWDTRNPRLHSLEAGEGEQLYNRVMEKAASLDIDYARIGNRRNRAWWVRGAVAAAVTGLLVAGGLWLFRTKPEAKPVAVQAIPQDANPGGVKATLTLGNGSKIRLEGSARGQLAKEGGAAVLQTDSGKLAYAHLKDASREVVQNTLSTPRGGKYSLKLADGTDVWLNAASSITYPTAFNGPERRVAITGEAYFEVARNAHQPFHVTVNGTDVEVLGTHFNINAYNDETAIKTTLLEGSVRVSKGGGSKILQPGQQAQSGPDNTILLIKDADTEMELAWRNNAFIFRNADLRTVMRQLSRWYDLDIVFQEGAPLSKRFEGEIPMDAMASQVLSILEKNGVRFRLDGKKLIVLP